MQRPTQNFRSDTLEMIAEKFVGHVNGMWVLGRDQSAGAQTVREGIVQHDGLRGIHGKLTFST